MTDAERAAYNEALVKFLRWYIKDEGRRRKEILRGLDRLERLVDEAPFLRAPVRRRGLFR